MPRTQRCHEAVSLGPALCPPPTESRCHDSFSVITQDTNGNNYNVIAGNYEYLIQDVWFPEIRGGTEGGATGVQAGCLNNPGQT